MDLAQSECIDFIGYLKSKGLADEDITKEKLRDEYNRHYKENANAHLPSYSKMIFNLKSQGFIRIKDGEYVHFNKQEKLHRPQPRNNPGNINPKEATSNSPNVSSWINKGFQGSGRQNKGFQRRPPQRPSAVSNLAVDQHVALRVRTNQRMENNNTSSANSSSKPKNSFPCLLCKVNCVSEKQFNEHQAGNRHKMQCLKFKLDVKRDQLLENKHGVVITAVNVTTQDAAKIEVYRKIGEVKRFNFEVRNQGKGVVELQSCVVLKTRPAIALDDPVGVYMGLKVVQIREGEKYDILATCETPNAGYEHEPILFQFKRNQIYFQILRNLTIITDTPLTDFLRPIAPYKAPPRAAVNPTEVAVIPGLRIERTGVDDKLEKTVELSYYIIPRNLRTIVNHGLRRFNGIVPQQLTLLNSILTDFVTGLTPENYCRFFHTLLYLEEIQMEVDIRRYDMEQSSLEVVRDQQHLLQLEVPGLMENRPSIVKGDRIYVNAHDREFEGIVHVVRERKVWIGFDRTFRESFINGLKFSVRFTFNRLPVRVGHRAVDLIEDLSLMCYLFPRWQRVSPESERLMKSTFHFRNRLIEDNLEQQQAVKSIVSGTSGSAPYIIYGPPGTGKTMTLVEAIKQVLIFHPEACVLACAPSNSAADVIASRLVENDPATKRKLFRLLAQSRDYETLPENIRDICNFDARENRYFYPPRMELSKYKIIITTLLTAGRVVSASFPPGHFTHVFIDECGHAIEPEAVVAIAGVLQVEPGKLGQLVLVGDPKQLGPILRSPIAIKNGLGVSILERLMQKDPYLRKPDGRDGAGSYNPYVMTKLLSNYRSHSSLLTVPNELFYDNELKAYADNLTRNQLCQYHDLPVKGFPIIFHGVVGKDEQEQRSPSFFNRAEIDVVVNYVKNLLSARSVNVKPEDIGIISPYNQQVFKIRMALQDLARRREIVKEMKGHDVNRITIGSTEEFQGQERKIIIISTVRSNPDLLKMDFTFKLGFLKNPKRFNVAVTRAKCLMIMIGNPHLLCLDYNWNSYLEYCVKNKAYVGTPYNFVDDDDELIQKLRNLDLGEDANAALEALLGNFEIGNDVNQGDDETKWRNDI